MKTGISLLTLGCLFANITLQGCATAPPPSNSPTPEPSAVAAPAAATSSEELSLDEATQFCVRLHEQVVGCAGEFIDLMLDLRSHYDPEFQAKFQTPEAQAEARKMGIEEVKADGAGPLEPRQQRCRGYAEHGPKTPRSAPPALEVCFQKSACAEKIECMRPVMERRFSARAEAAPKAPPAQ